MNDKQRPINHITCALYDIKWQTLMTALSDYNPDRNHLTETLTNIEMAIGTIS